MRPRSATAAPAETRSQPVNLDRDGICGSASVNVRRGQSCVRHCHR
ncbi:hypothetical protein [Catenulispora sp. EB89]